MGFTDQFWRALQKYRLAFPTLVSLGTSAATWLAERERVEGTALAQVLLTSGSHEGGSQSGERSFPGELLVDALDCRRFELDDTYTLPEHLGDFAAASASRRKRKAGGIVMQFSP